LTARSYILRGLPDTGLADLGPSWSFTEWSSQKPKIFGIPAGTVCRLPVPAQAIAWARPKQNKFETNSHPGSHLRNLSLGWGCQGKKSSRRKSQASGRLSAANVARNENTSSSARRFRLNVQNVDQSRLPNENTGEPEGTKVLITRTTGFDDSASPTTPT